MTCNRKNTIVAACLLLVCAPCLARGPATAPASDVKRLFAQLADKDPDTRDAARIALMGLKPVDLNTLRSIVAQSRPISPAQVSVLREIVTHVYLRGVDYREELSGTGFLGVTPNQVYGNVGDADSDQPGVWVLERVPGFCAYRMLQDNDILLRVVESPRSLDATSLREVIQSFHAGDTIHLDVQRAGRVVRIAVTLDPRPADVERAETFRTERRRKADGYWDRNFAPLVEGETS